MAVIKTCCGCFSTKGGSLAVLFLHFVGYISSIIELSILIQGDDLGSLWKNTILQTQVFARCNTTTYNDTWRCDSLESVTANSKWIAIGLIVAAGLLTISCLIAIVGTIKDCHYLLLPWIVADCISFIAKVCGLLLALIYWALSLQVLSADSSYLIAAIVVSAGVLALCFYMWLCVVSHFQTLKELRDLGYLSGDDDKKEEDSVHPFVHTGSQSSLATGDDAATEEIKSVTSRDEDSDDDDDDDDDGEDNTDVENPKDNDKDDSDNEDEKEDGRSAQENNE